MEDATAQPAGPVQAARRLRLSNKVQAALLELAQRAITSPDIEEVSTELARQAKKFLKTDAAGLVLIENNRHVRLIFDTGAPPAGLVILADTILAGRGLTGRAYQTGQLLATNDYINDARFEHHPVVDNQVRQDGLAANLAAPVVGQDKKVVALLWLGKFRPYQWKETDFWQAQQFAEMAGLVITSYQTYQALSTTNRELTLRNQQLETLHKFVQGLHSSEDFKATAERGLRLAIEAAQAEAGSIHLLEEPDATEMVLALQAGQLEPAQLNKAPAWLERVKLGSGLSGTAAQTRQTMVINDLPEVYRQNPNLPLNPNPIWHTMLFIPLVALDQLIGVLTLASRQKVPFSAEQVRFTESIGAQLALVLYQTLQLERQKLLAVQALANTAAHDLIQQLAVIQALLDLSLKLGQPVDNETLHIMQEAVTTMTKQVREYRHIVRVEITEPVPGITMLDRIKSLKPEEES